MLVPAFMWLITPCYSFPISSAHALIHFLPLGPCLRVKYSSVTPVKGSIMAKISTIFSEAVSSVEEAWFAVMRKTVLFSDALDPVKGLFFLLI